MAEKEITIEIKKPEAIILLCFFVTALALELIVTINSPIAFGDEGYHTAMAQYIAGRQEYFVWQPFETTKLEKRGFVRPPAWNLLEAGFFYLFGFSEAAVKVLTPFIATILIGSATYILVKRIFNSRAALIAAMIIVSIPSFVTYSVLFGTEMLLVLYMTLFILIFILALQTGSRKYLILSAVFGGLALLTKTSAFIVFPIVPIAFLYMAHKEKNYTALLKQFLLVAVFLAVVYGTFFMRNLALFNIAGTQMLGLTGEAKSEVSFSYTPKFSMGSAAAQSGTGLSVLKYGIRNYIEFAYGNPWFVVLGLICGTVLLVARRSRAEMLLAVALLAFLPIIYFTAFGGRAEDASRYGLVILPAMAAAAALYFDAVYEFIKSYYKKLALIVFVLVIVLSMQQLYTKLLAKDNSGNYAGMMGVKQFSPLFFDACDFIKKNTTADSLVMTIWDHQAVYNCQRNVISPSALPDQGDIQLSKDINLTVSRLKAHGITHVFIQKFSVSSGNSDGRYSTDFIDLMNGNPKNFKKIFENGASIETCSSQDGCGGNIVYEVV